MIKAERAKEPDNIVSRDRQNQMRASMGEIYGICSLIHLNDGFVVASIDEARRVPIVACSVEREFAQMVTYAFHPELHPAIKGYLRGAGWCYLTQWPSAHPNNPPMELWGIHTGQEQH